MAKKRKHPSDLKAQSQPKLPEQPQEPSGAQLPALMQEPTLGQVHASQLQRIDNPVLPTIWIDSLQVAVRSDVPIAMFRFHTRVGDTLIEASRVQTSVAHLKKILDVIAKTIGYYPAPQGEVTGKEDKADHPLGSTTNQKGAE